MGHRDASPSAFVLRSVAKIRRKLGSQLTALDVAMGTGRHTVVLAEAGFRVFGVDDDLARVTRARAELVARGFAGTGIWVMDLESGPLPAGHFDVVVCTRYLQRRLWSALRDAVQSGGFMVYETFTTDQRHHDWGPRSSDHLLAPGELREAFDGWHIWDYEERKTPAAEASLLARKPS